MSGIWLILGPIIGKALEQILQMIFDKWFKKAEARSPGADVSTKAGAIEVMERAYQMLPFLAFFRKATLRRTIALAKKDEPPTPDELDELEGMALAADNE